MTRSRTDLEVSFLEESGTVQPVAAVPDRTERGEWLLAHRPELRRLTLRHGSLRLIGAAVASTDELAGVAAVLGGGALEYTERSTPRSRVAGSVYTSTEYPADQRIPQHNESLLLLALAGPPLLPRHPHPEHRRPDPGRGQPHRPHRAPAELVEKFSALGVRYTRAYHDGIGLSWQEAFQTEDRGHIEAYCRDNGIAWEWEGDLLRTSQVRPALTRHPVTGETVWFNQAHLFHIGSLPAKTTEALLAVFPEQNLPRNAYFGDGSPIDADTLAEIHAAFDRTTLAPDWTQGDVMVVDNILASHGRAPTRATAPSWSP